MSSTFGTRLKEAIEYTKATQTAFADQIGIQRTYLSRLLSDANEPGMALVRKILEAIPTLNANWLITGEGDMTSDTVQKNIRTLYSNANYLPGAVASAGYGAFTEQVDTIAPRRVALPWLPGSGYLVIHVDGDSMHPTLDNKDLVVIRELTNIEELVPSRLYVVMYEGSGFVKRLKEVDGRFVTFTSDNPDFGPVVVDLKENPRFYRVHEVIRKNASFYRLNGPNAKPDEEWFKRLERLEAQFDEMRVNKGRSRS